MIIYIIFKNKTKKFSNFKQPSTQNHKNILKIASHLEGAVFGQNFKSLGFLKITVIAQIFLFTSFIQETTKNDLFNATRTFLLKLRTQVNGRKVVNRQIIY